MIPACITFLLFILAAILAGAVLVYPLELLLHDVISIPYHKLITHTTLLCGLVASALYLKRYRLLTRTTLGYGPRCNLFTRKILLGFGAGLLIIFVVEVCLLCLGVHASALVPGWQTIMNTAIKALLAGMVVGFIEETIFRGALLGGLLQQTNTLVAVTLSSLVYAAVHFIKYRALGPETELHWYTGLEMLPKALFRFSDPVIIDTFATLFVFGVLLALIRIRNNHIAWCIGIHAGVVAAISLVRNFTNPVPGSGYSFLVNDYNNLLGWLTFFWLTLITVIYFRQGTKSTHAGA